MTQIEKIKDFLESSNYQEVGSFVERALEFIDSLPPEPKFKVGQRIREPFNELEYVITGIEDDKYLIGGNGAIPFSEWEDWELVESDDLSKAAYSYARSLPPYKDGNCAEYPNPYIEKAFISGAEWQRNQPNIEPFTTVIPEIEQQIGYERGVIAGMEMAKKQMNRGWKPSENQLVSLEAIICGWQPKAADMRNLKTLYSDLKALYKE